MSSRIPVPFPKFNLPLLPHAFQRVDFGEKLRFFEQAVRQHGYQVSFTPVSLCPCLVVPKDGGDGTPDVNCPSCVGLGRLYDEDRSYTTKALLTGINRDVRVQQPEGRYEMGTVAATFNWRLETGVEVTINYWDRFRMVDAFVPVLESRRLQPHEDRVKLRFQPREIVSVYSRDPVTRALVCIVVGQDASLDVEKGELLLGGAKKYEGMPLAITYTGQPPYYIVDLPNQYRGEPVKQGFPEERWGRVPMFCLARRGDFIEAAGA